MEDRYGLLIAALVAVVAVVGLVILFSGSSTGQVVKISPLTSQDYAAKDRDNAYLPVLRDVNDRLGYYQGPHPNQYARVAAPNTPIYQGVEGQNLWQARGDPRRTSGKFDVWGDKFTTPHRYAWE